MNAEHRSSEAAPAMEPAFKDFFDKALPNNGGRHTLTLGEYHDTTDHLHWLQQHLPQLKKAYGITTIGVERPACYNPLFWAYKDGTLAKKLGGKTEAQNYVRAVLLATAKPVFRENASETADLLMSAMDTGMDVVAYDSRHSYKTLCDDWQGEITQYKKTSEDDRQANRKNADFLEEIIKDLNDKIWPWFLMEVAWLKQLKPEYKVKFDAAEDLIARGHEKINGEKLTSDALSATLFNAMARPNSNRLTIGGKAHINGIGNLYLYKDKKIQQVHGTFGHHLFAMGQSPEMQQPHQVTGAVIATTAVGNTISKSTALDFSESIHKGVHGHQVHHLNLDTGKIEPVWQPEADHERVVSLEEKFLETSTRGSSVTDEAKARTQAHINPLLMPDIKKASDTLSAAMDGSSNDRPR